MLKYILPKDDAGVKDRVKLAVLLSVGAKVMNVTVAFILKYTVDYLNVGRSLKMETTPSTVASSLLLGSKENLYDT